MSSTYLILIGISLFGFLWGLYGKAIAVKKGSIRKSEFYKYVTVISLILMFTFVIVYRLTL
jgi:hypothetical protein